MLQISRISIILFMFGIALKVAATHLFKICIYAIVVDSYWSSMNTDVNTLEDFVHWYALEDFVNRQASSMAAASAVQFFGSTLYHAAPFG